MCCVYFLQEKLECFKRGWEVQQLKKLKEEEEEHQMAEGEEDLFTYTREDAYNMVVARSNLRWSKKVWFAFHICWCKPFFVLQQEYVFDAEDGQTEIMPVRHRIWHVWRKLVQIAPIIVECDGLCTLWIIFSLTVLSGTTQWKYKRQKNVFKKWIYPTKFKVTKIQLP